MTNYKYVSMISNGNKRKFSLNLFPLMHVLNPTYINLSCLVCQRHIFLIKRSHSDCPFVLSTEKCEMRSAFLLYFVNIVFGEVGMHWLQTKDNETWPSCVLLKQIEIMEVLDIKNDTVRRD